jgi:hypothetical protein
MGQRALRALAAVLGMVAMTLASAATASASPWKGIQLPAPANKVFLLGASCPTTSLCVVVGTNNLIASSTDPTGGIAAWSYGYAGEGPWPNTDSFPSDRITGRQIQAVSCPSATLCVAVTSLGQIYSTTRPTSPPSSWRVTQMDAEGINLHLHGVSCPTVSLCVAVSGGRNDNGKVLTSTNPDGGAATWQVVQLDKSLDLRGISCGSPSFCVAVGEEGRIVTSTNPTGDAGAWNVLGAPSGPASLHGVSCVAVVLCVTGNLNGNVLSSTNPAGGLSSWKEVDGGGSVLITGASCASATQCVVVDNNGDVLTSTDPSGDRSAWSFTNLIPFKPVGKFELEGNALFGASCPSGSLCVLTGALGQIFTSTSPFAKPPAPEKPKQLRGPKRPRARIATVLLLHNREQLLRGKGRAMIRFYARGRVRAFLCRLDGRPLKRCRSPKGYRVGVGRHVFRVRAVGLTGLKGPVARKAFIVRPPCTDHVQPPTICL